MKLVEGIFAAIIILCLIVIIGGRIVLLVFAKYYENNPEAGAPKCKKCKTKMVAGERVLYLIPVMFDKEHEESAEYYLKNARKIEDESQIPTGQRACRICLFRCPQCSKRVVSVVDFLKNRDNEVIFGGDIYPYEKFRDFIS